MVLVETVDDEVSAVDAAIDAALAETASPGTGLRPGGSTTTRSGTRRAHIQAMRDAAEDLSQPPYASELPGVPSPRATTTPTTTELSLVETLARLSRQIDASQVDTIARQSRQEMQALLRVEESERNTQLMFHALEARMDRLSALGDRTDDHTNQNDRTTRFSDDVANPSVVNRRESADDRNDTRNDIQDALREESQRSGVAPPARSFDPPTTPSGTRRPPVVQTPSGARRPGLMTALTPGPVHGSTAHSSPYPDDDPPVSFRGYGAPPRAPYSRGGVFIFVTTRPSSPGKSWPMTKALTVAITTAL
jgi:hypothetical protein